MPECLKGRASLACITEEILRPTEVTGTVFEVALGGEGSLWAKLASAWLSNEDTS